MIELWNLDYIASTLNVNDLTITIIVMNSNLRISEELHPTFHTLPDFHVHVSPLMCFFIPIRNECFAAIWALIFLFACVDLHVRYKTVFEFELLSTYFIRALITIILAQKRKSIYTFFHIRVTFFIFNRTLKLYYRFCLSLFLSLSFNLVFIFFILSCLRHMDWILIEKSIADLLSMILECINLEGWFWIISTWCTWLFCFVRFRIRTWRSCHIDLFELLIRLEDNWHVSINIVRFLIDQFFLDDVVESHLTICIIKWPDHIWCLSNLSRQLLICFLLWNFLLEHEL